MRVHFRTLELQRAYERSSQAKRLWGEAVARKYIQRMEVLYASPSFDAVRQIKSLRAHKLKPSARKEWALDLNERWRLIVSPSEDGKEVTVTEVTSHYGD